MTYPTVVNELQTLRAVLAGKSLARYGDGEFKHCADKKNVSQMHHPRLSARLREILIDSGDCLVGIPNLNPEALALMPDEKCATWTPYRYSTLRWLSADRVYYSAFVTRPDSAPWINTPTYWATLQSLWNNRTVTLVGGSQKSLQPEDLVGARSVRHVVTSRQHAFAESDVLLERIGTPDLAILCVGPTATVLAADLCAKGVQAVDLGHVALFLRKYRRGEPMVLSKDDKSHDKARAVA